MNRELDAFFAKAEDVLTDWVGGTDAMHGHAPRDEDALPPRADSYYEQPSAPRSATMEWLAERDAVSTSRRWRMEVMVEGQWMPFPGLGSFVIDQYETSDS